MLSAKKRQTTRLKYCQVKTNTDYSNTSYLTPVQKSVYKNMNFDKWYSANDLDCSLPTLKALAKFKLLEMKGEQNVGLHNNARDIVKFKKIEE